MKEIIGRTRHGQDVWIEVIANKHRELRLLVSEFESSEDNYDAFCVIETYSRRLQYWIGGRQSQVTDFIADALDKYLAQPKPAGFASEAAALGHFTSPDRLRYGMKLLHPAYRWKQ